MFEASIQPICLPYADHILEDYSDLPDRGATIAGWGATGYSDDEDKHKDDIDFKDELQGLFLYACHNQLISFILFAPVITYSIILLSENAHFWVLVSTIDQC